jgi:hypothetical protein
MCKEQQKTRAAENKPLKKTEKKNPADFGAFQLGRLLFSITVSLQYLIWDKACLRKRMQESQIKARVALFRWSMAASLLLYIF